MKNIFKTTIIFLGFVFFAVLANMLVGDGTFVSGQSGTASVDNGFRSWFFK